VDPAILDIARAARGFMPDVEGLALHDAALRAKSPGPWLEVGSYCGKSAVYLGAAARDLGRVLFSVDHHRGSEENQPGWEYHEPDLVDPGTGLIDTLPCFRATIAAAGLEDVVVGVVGRSDVVAAQWAAPLALLFIDGGHSEAAAHADYQGWAGHLTGGGVMAIHDVFPDPGDGGRAPYDVYIRALADGFVEESATGSLRVLRRR